MGKPTRPFLSLAPRASYPLVLTCEHATHRLPHRGRLAREARAILRSHWGWDPGAWALTRVVRELLGASAVGGRWSRLWIDLNRRADDPTLIRARAEGIDLPWNLSLTEADVERRLLEIHVPYHIEVDRVILRRLVRGVRPLLLAVHTFTPELRRRRRAFDAGVLYDRHGNLARRLARGLRDAGLSVRYNQPYSGIAGMMYSIDRHGSHHGLPCLELEINQAILSERTATRRLGRAVARVVGELVADEPFSEAGAGPSRS